eukprot:5374306-Amphidinium_carterae.1
MQRYKAVEAVAAGQSWEEAKHLEIGRPASVGLASTVEQRAALRQRLTELKLAASRKSAGKAD